MLQKEEIDWGAALEAAKVTIQMEAAAILSLLPTIESETFRQVLECLLHCKGRVVVTGIGKSAIIAQKIVATMNSTGTQALFMHAADAVHGDLGIISSDDVIIVLSKSGGTPEIATLLRFLKKMNNVIVGIGCEPNSYLGEVSDYFLCTPYKQEADPNNLAPTTSSTAQIAIGDALAMSLLKIRNFQIADFARFHPGGSLGKQLYLKVEDVCHHHEKPSVYENSSIRDLIIEISSKRLGASAVLDENTHLIGIVTDGDIRRMLEKYESWTSLSIKDIMTPNPKTVSSDLLATDALRIMRKHAITQLPVLKNNRYFGVVHLHDLLREGILDS